MAKIEENRPQIRLFECKIDSSAHFYVPFPSGPPGETRIMDLDQYLEKMNTNTNVI